MLSWQLIFRKVSDMKREKELAERRKNEPKLDQNQDHLVRKIFSRFRKGQSTSSTNLLPGGSTPAVSNGPCGSQSGTPSHGQRDVERGELTQQTSEENAAGTITGAAGPPPSPRRDSRVSLVRAAKEDETAASSRASSAKSKWGRMLRGNSNSVDVAGSVDSSTTDPAAQQSLLPGPMNALANKLANKGGAGDQSSGRAQSAGGSGNKVHPKLSRVPERQETSDEQVPASTNARLLRADAVQQPDFGSPSGLESPSIIESFTELKHEVRNEVQRINHKMSRLEDILGEILVRLTPPQPIAPPPRSSASRTRSSQEPDDAPVVVDVDGSNTTRPRPTNRARSQGSAGKTRPRSSGSGEKLTTQFQEYV